MNRSLVICVAVFVCLAVGSVALGGEATLRRIDVPDNTVIRPAAVPRGRIPIYEPTTITEPGSYVVMSDITATDGPAIVIANEAVNVSLDLNGHTITSVGTDKTWTVKIVQDIDRLDLDVTITNGRIGGWGVATARKGGATARVMAANTMLTLGVREVDFLDGGMQMADTHLTVTGCTIAKSISLGESATTTMLVRITDNLLLDGSISLSWATGVIRNNVLRSGGIEFLRESSRVLIENNRLNAIRILHSTHGGFVIRGNILSNWFPVRDRAVFVGDGEDNLIQDNVVRCRSDAVGIDLGAEVYRSLVDGNLVSGCDVGLRIGGEDNTYRNNVFRNSTTAAVVDYGEESNIDAGGNVY